MEFYHHLLTIFINIYALVLVALNSELNSIMMMMII